MKNTVATNTRLLALGTAIAFASPAQAGVGYYKHDYSIMSMIPAQGAENLASLDISQLYPSMALSLKPQLQQYFTLLADGKAPIMVNCKEVGITPAQLNRIRALYLE